MQYKPNAVWYPGSRTESETRDKDYAAWQLETEVAKLREENRTLKAALSAKKRVVPAERKLQSRKRHNTYTQAKSSALQRNLPWHISSYEYYELMDHPCYYCSNTLGLTGIRLDRLDNSEGYLMHNVVPCCGRCNMVRNSRIRPDHMVLVGRLLAKLEREDDSLYT